jgi:hypothetical protein
MCTGSAMFSALIFILMLARWTRTVLLDDPGS